MKRRSNQKETKIIGVSGCFSRSGCTHFSLIIANSLKEMGYKVALLEENIKGTFSEIANEYNCHIDDNNRFSMNDIDYYIYQRPRILPKLLQKGYHFIVIDHGEFMRCDKDLFLSNFPAIITCGTRPWEINKLEDVFSEIEEESILEAIHAGYGI